MEYPLPRILALLKSKVDENQNSERKPLQAAAFRCKFGTYRKKEQSVWSREQNVLLKHWH
jgi:hypothetical protein